MPSLVRPADEIGRKAMLAASRGALLVRCGPRSASGLLLLDQDDDLQDDGQLDGALVLAPGLLLGGDVDPDEEVDSEAVVKKAPAMKVVLRRGQFKRRTSADVTPGTASAGSAVGTSPSPPSSRTPTHPDDLAELPARVVAAWRWAELAETLPDVLAEFKLSRDPESDAEVDVPLTREARGMLSVFLLLRLKPVPAEAPCPLESLRRLLPRVPAVPPRGAPVCTSCAPLGALALLGAVCRGVVSGTAPGGLLVLTDARVTPGSEGAGVFAVDEEAKLPVAVVLSPLTWWRGEAVGFTMCLGLRRLLADGLRHLERPPRRRRAALGDASVAFGQHEDLLGLDRSVVLVRCAHMWGSGVVVGRRGARPVVLTCAHVLPDANKAVRVCWGEHRARATVLWRSPDGETFDVAVLEVDDADPCLDELLPLDMDCSRPLVGESVVAAGFPLFSELSCHASPALRPLVSGGEVSGWWPSAPSQVLTTCCVQSGASGGALVRFRGGRPAVIGVLVCNAQLGTGRDAVVYPHVNLALWVDAIAGPVNAFLDSGDKSVLTKLQCRNVAVQRQWKLLPPNMCKL